MPAPSTVLYDCSPVLPERESANAIDTYPSISASCETDRRPRKIGSPNARIGKTIRQYFHAPLSESCLPTRLTKCSHERQLQFADEAPARKRDVVSYPAFFANCPLWQMHALGDQLAFPGRRLPCVPRTLRTGQRRRVCLTRVTGKCRFLIGFLKRSETNIEN